MNTTLDTTKKRLVDMLNDAYKKGSSLAIKVTRFFTDVDGVILDTAVMPANLQVDYPVYMFGEFDRQGSYFAAQKNVPAMGNSKFLCAFVWGTASNPYFFGFTGLSNIQNYINPGDLVQVYTDDLIAPNYFIFIVQSISGAALGSILSNVKTTKKDGRLNTLETVDLRYFSQYEPQWQKGLFVYNLDNVGNIVSDWVNPYTYRIPVDTSERLIYLPWKISIDQYYGLAFYLDINANEIVLDFSVKKLLT